MKTGNILLIIVLLIIAAFITFDKMYISKFEDDFTTLEKKRIVTSNKLATAKIVYENLNHVRDLVFKNMDFFGQESAAHESIFFEFLTTCINDLKLKLISAKPIRPKTTGQITTYGYTMEIEGDFFKFGELCAKFENSRRIISTEDFDVKLIESSNKNTSKNYVAKQDQSSTHKGIAIKLGVETYRIKKTQEQDISSVNVKAVTPDGFKNNPYVK